MDDCYFSGLSGYEPLKNKATYAMGPRLLQHVVPQKQLPNLSWCRRPLLLPVLGALR